VTAQTAEKTRFSWHDYRQWPDSERWELIDGGAFNMSPAPSTRHQKVAARLYSRLEKAVEGRGCQPFIAPTDLRLSDFDIVQPDLLLVSNLDQITDSHIEGAPDLVVEVLSPATSAKDLREKKGLYQRAGIPLYLVIDPLEQYALLFRLDESGVYDSGTIFAPQETLELALCGGIAIDLWEVFELPAPGSASDAEPVSHP
jgi:Uma2 family endonuclease